ncbi:hypothetical protein CCH79_00010621 [Gambusia affinis]|uniref:Uncharacterized protein n=1 Tax=Gambusia affinis TaxID=33528 RepID=A0A315W6R9_GAMAF|nr:hypothetical protein CCH79_00010621 [Gambusia affinis]
MKAAKAIQGPTTVTSYYSLVTKEAEETIVTGPSPTDPQVALQDVVPSTTEPVAADTDVPTTESNQILDTTTVEVTGAPTVHTSASAETTSPPPETTAAPAFETSVPEETSSPFIHETVAPITSADATTGTDNGSAGVTVETEESLSTGQIVGIVIGAIVAVVIVIAVVIAVLRRMGKYSGLACGVTVKHHSTHMQHNKRVMPCMCHKNTTHVHHDVTDVHQAGVRGPQNSYRYDFYHYPLPSSLTDRSLHHLFHSLSYLLGLESLGEELALRLGPHSKFLQQMKKRESQIR